jgi:hypothetical protein
VAKKRQSSGLRMFVVFVLLVVVVGVVLSATDNFDSPFAAISELTAVNNLVEGQQVADDSTIQPLPPMEGLDNAPLDANQGQDMMALDGEQDAGNIDWSLIGNVLFNLWFFCVATAVIVVLQKVLTSLLRAINVQVLPARE